MILVGITGDKEANWKSKLGDINRRKITEAALFLERFKKDQREKIYKALLNSNIKKIPLVHARNDMTRGEFVFLEDNFRPLCFTIHEDSFKYLDKWRGFHKKLFLEMNADNSIAGRVRVNKIGGFCVDLAHFKIDEESWTKEFEYIAKKEKTKRYFLCNHLNGYSYAKNHDLHTITSLKDFDYLKTLPKFLFGRYIALEMENSIAEQLKFKKYLEKILY